MRLTEEDLKEFKRIYKKEFGEDISDKDALEKATRLIRLVKAVYKPIKKSDFEKFDNKGSHYEPRKKRKK